MKKYIYVLQVVSLIAASCLLNTSCKKLVEVPPAPPTQLSSDQLFLDSASTMGAMAGVYANFGTIVNSPDLTFGSGYITLVGGLASDELVNNQPGNFSVDAFYRNTLISNNGAVAALWGNAYTSLYQVNACIEGIGNSTRLSASLKKQLLGELEVVRAFYYFNLVNLFGGVPLVTMTDYKVSASLPRVSVNQVYDQIISDLKEAQGRLLPAYPSIEKARPNLYTAVGLLAKVYLYRGQWQNAYDLATAVIVSGQYQLEKSLDRCFLNKSTEALWQLPAAGSSTQTPEASTFIPYDTTIIPDYTISESLLAAFQNNDKRKKQWLGVNTVSVNNADVLFYYPAKYKNNNSVTATTTEDYMLLRYADIYLIRAEAAAQLGKLDDALSDLNVVHTRSVPGSIILSAKADILNAIMQERQVEFFCEWGSRWYDLKRSGKIDAVLSPIKSGWDAHDSLFPIPQTEIGKNRNLVQNQGY